MPPKLQSPTTVEARKSDSPTVRARRAWYSDAALSFASFTILFVLGKGVTRMFGPFAGLFFLLIFGGAGWYLAKSAWRGLLGDRADLR